MNLSSNYLKNPKFIPTPLPSLNNRRLNYRVNAANSHAGTGSIILEQPPLLVPSPYVRKERFRASHAFLPLPTVQLYPAPYELAALLRPFLVYGRLVLGNLPPLLLEQPLAAGLHAPPVVRNLVPEVHGAVVVVPLDTEARLPVLEHHSEGLFGVLELLPPVVKAPAVEERVLRAHSRYEAPRVAALGQIFSAPLPEV